MTSEEKEMICHSADPEYRVWRETVGEEHTENVDDRSLSLITAHQGCQCAVRNVDHRVKESGNEVICNRYVNILSDGSGVWNEKYKHTCYGNRYCQP